MGTDDSENGSGKVHDLTIEILRDIRDEMRRMSGKIDETNLRLDETNLRLDQTNRRLDDTNHRLEDGFAGVNARIDGLSARVDHILIGPFGETVRDLTTRVQRIEHRLDRMEPKPKG
jgi:hypothetical protein